MAVPFVVELLVIVTCPIAVPAAGGSNCTFRVVEAPGFRVTGKLYPEIEYPGPVATAAFTVTAADPVEVRVTDCVAGVLINTSPNATVVAFIPNEAVAVTTELSCIWNVFTAVAVRAVIVTVVATLTGKTVVLKPVVDLRAATVTPKGTVTAALSLERLTFSLTVVLPVR